MSASVNRPVQSVVSSPSRVQRADAAVDRARARTRATTGEEGYVVGAVAASMLELVQATGLNPVPDVWTLVSDDAFSLSDVEALLSEAHPELTWTDCTADSEARARGFTREAKVTAANGASWSVAIGPGTAELFMAAGSESERVTYATDGAISRHLSPFSTLSRDPDPIGAAGRGCWDQRS